MISTSTSYWCIRIFTSTDHFNVRYTDPEFANKIRCRCSIWASERGWKMPVMWYETDE